MKTVDFSESIAACDLTFGTCRQLIEFSKILVMNIYLHDAGHMAKMANRSYMVKTLRNPSSEPVDRF